MTDTPRLAEEDYAAQALAIAQGAAALRHEARVEQRIDDPSIRERREELWELMVQVGQLSQGEVPGGWD